MVSDYRRGWLVIPSVCHFFSCTFQYTNLSAKSDVELQRVFPRSFVRLPTSIAYKHCCIGKRSMEYKCKQLLEKTCGMTSRPS